MLTDVKIVGIGICHQMETTILAAKSRMVTPKGELVPKGVCSYGRKLLTTHVGRFNTRLIRITTVRSHPRTVATTNRIVTLS